MKQRYSAAIVSLVCAGCAAHAMAQTAISADGVIESRSGGFKFPDGSVQITAAAPGSALVESTGQTQCFDEDGTLRDCAGTGEDGELQAGVSWPTPRFTDNGDGTVTDNLSGLIWLKDVNCPGAQKVWQEALDWVSSLNATSIACAEYAPMTYADWRLSNVKELTSLIDWGQLDPALPVGHPFTGVRIHWYWSSSSSFGRPSNGWLVNLFNGWVWDSAKQAKGYVWPVRSVDRVPHAVVNTAFSADGVIESAPGGFEFPDGSVQVAAAAPGYARVEDTGQAQCFDEEGALRNCVGTGEDGETQAGIAWPTPRFTDNGDGTVTDNLTGLIWLQDAECFGGVRWQTALDAVADFALGAHGCANYPAQVYPGWRLANVNELASLTDYRQMSPGLPDGHPFINVLPVPYWSSSTYVSRPVRAWYVYLNGLVGRTYKNYKYYVWPVRGGR